jgi:Beta-galactosidase
MAAESDSERAQADHEQATNDRAAARFDRALNTAARQTVARPKRGWLSNVGLVMAGALLACIGVGVGLTVANNHAGTTVTSGIYVFSGANTNVVEQVASGSFTRVQGFDWIATWKSIEPTRGVFDFSRVDAAIAAARSHGWYSQVAVIPGEYAPDWVLSSCPTIQIVSHVTGNTVTMANPITTCFQNDLAAMISVVGAHYNGYTNVSSIQATGLGVLGETVDGVLPSNAQALGITAPALLAGWERAITEWRTAAPLTPQSLAIGEPIGSKAPIMPSLLAWVKTTYGAKVFIQQNGLTSSMTGGTIWNDIKAASVWTTGGWETTFTLANQT